MGQGFQVTFPRYAHNSLSLTTITPTARSRIKENIKFSQLIGHKKLAIDLALHVYLADTLHYNRMLDSAKK